MTRTLAIATLLAVAATPALAAEFYVVQDTSTKKCTIVSQRPTVSTTVVVGSGVYTTQSEAEAAMKKVAICTN
jgi:hypothetical protein